MPPLSSTSKTLAGTIGPLGNIAGSLGTTEDVINDAIEKIASIVAHLRRRAAATGAG